MPDALPRLETRHDLVLLNEAIPWKDQRDMFSNRFRSAVAEYPLSGRVPAGDETVLSLADDGIVGGLDDLRQQPVGAFALCRFLLYLRQVADNTDEKALVGQP